MWADTAARLHSTIAYKLIELLVVVLLLGMSEAVCVRQELLMID